MLDLRSGVAPTFVENLGQFDPQVRFQLRGGQTTLWVTNTGIVFDVIRSPQPDPRPGEAAPEKATPLRGFGLDRVLSGFSATPSADRVEPTGERIVFSQELLNARNPVVVEGRSPRPGAYNFLIGNDPRKWRTGVRGYSEVIYRRVWPGIDLRLLVKGSALEQEFIIAPGANPSQIQIAYQGIESLRAEQDGSLVIRTPAGELRESKPLLYQEIAGKRVPVDGRFKLASQTAYTFEVDSYRADYALVVDPTLLYSTFLGGSQGVYGYDLWESSSGIAVDASGNAYVVGWTRSTDFPTTPGTLPHTGFLWAFVTKLNPLGNALVYSTYVGSITDVDNIAVDASGDAHIVGVAQPGFPTTPGAYQACSGTESACWFLSKLNPAGDALLYSSCFGGYSGSLGRNPRKLALGASGKVYVAGVAAYGLPTTPNAFQTSTSGIDAFVAKIDPFASGAAALLYVSYLGGGAGGETVAESVAVDSFENMYVTGYTCSRGFPTTPGAFQGSLPAGMSCGSGAYWEAQCSSAFVAKWNPALSGQNSLVYATYLGGSLPAWGLAIAVDMFGNAYVGGQVSIFTRTSEGPVVPFPTTPGAFQTTADNTYPGFVTKLNTAGNGLVYSTYLRGTPAYGTNQSWVNGIAVDGGGNAYVVGNTRALGFPVTPDAFQPLFKGEYDAFVAKLNATGSALLYSTYLGGFHNDEGRSIAIDSVGDAYVTGFTGSADFPVTPGAYQTQMRGNADAFVTKLPLGDVLRVLQVTPSRVGNAGTVTPSVYGTGFHIGASIKLVCGGASQIPGAGAVVGPTPRMMTASFNLVGAGPGICDIAVTNPDGTSAVLQRGLTVEEGGKPEVWLDVVGRSVIRGGRPQAYTVLYGNRGSIDAKLFRVWISFPSFVTLSPPPSPALASTGQLAGTAYAAFEVPGLALALTGSIAFMIRAPDTPDFAHRTFTMFVWAEMK